MVSYDEELLPQELGTVVLQCLDDGEQLAVLDGICSLSRGHGLGEVANGFPFAVILLLPYNTNRCITRRVCLNSCRSARPEESQNRGLTGQSLHRLESLSLLFVPFEGGVFLQ